MNAIDVARSAGLAYLASAPVSMSLALRDDLVAAPLGLRTGLTVRRDLMVGYGTAVSAPPPMLVALAGLLRASGSGRRRGLALLAGLGATFVAGQVAEPITHEVLRRPTARPAHTAVVAGNIVLPATVLIAALRELAREVDGENVAQASEQGAGGDEAAQISPAAPKAMTASVSSAPIVANV